MTIRPLALAGPARLVAVVAVVASSAVLSTAGLGANARNARACGTVRTAKHVYLVTATEYSCARATSYVHKLAAEKPKGAATGLAVGKLSGGPAGFSCGASGWPQRIGRCFKGALSFTWVKEQ